MELKERKYHRDLTVPGLETQVKYEYYVAYGFWSALRCWKNEQWSYSVANENGNIWQQVRDGKDVYYKGENFTIDCKKGQYVDIVSLFPKTLKDGAYPGSTQSDIVQGNVVSGIQSGTRVNMTVLAPDEIEGWVYVYNSKNKLIGSMGISRLCDDTEAFKKQLAKETKTEVGLMRVRKSWDDVE